MVPMYKLSLLCFQLLYQYWSTGVPGTWYTALIHSIDNGTHVQVVSVVFSTAVPVLVHRRASAVNYSSTNVVLSPSCFPSLLMRVVCLASLQSHLGVHLPYIPVTLRPPATPPMPTPPPLLATRTPPHPLPKHYHNHYHLHLHHHHYHHSQPAPLLPLSRPPIVLAQSRLSALQAVLIIVGCSSHLRRLAEHLASLRAWCKQSNVYLAR